ncbi:MAG: exo-alpha-sialidase, partial [Anaerolineae bacterium]|nr:exo-alpha-sialidase [Anaerolineae bacterium]
MTRMQSVVRWIGVAVVLGMLGLPALRPAQGQTLRWSEPVPLSRSGKFAWFPEIVSDRSGKVHVVWAEGYLGFDAVFYTSSINGTDWRAQIDIQAVQMNEYGPSAVRPSITIAQDSEMHLTYFTDSSGVLHTRAPVWNAGVVQAWAEPVKVNGIQAGYFSRIVEDQAGILHMFFTENVPTTTCQICFHVFYRQSQDNGDTWSERVDVSVEDIGSAKPNPLVDKDGNLHVVWESGFGGGQGQLSDPTSVMVASSYDGGLTWS